MLHCIRLFDNSVPKHLIKIQGPFIPSTKYFQRDQKLLTLVQFQACFVAHLQLYNTKGHLGSHSILLPYVCCCLVHVISPLSMRNIHIKYEEYEKHFTSTFWFLFSFSVFTSQKRMLYIQECMWEISSSVFPIQQSFL